MSLNPALPLLALLGVAGLLLGLRAPGGLRREIGLAWGALAVAGLALLAPALSMPDGIPSPAATLAGQPPWQGTGDPAEGNPVLRDVTFQIQPWQLFARRELRAGRLPLWNPHQFSGAPFWANGQSAPLFPLHLLFAALPLQLGFVLLPWLRLLIAGCGAWVLGRELGLSRPAALLAALTFSLSGMLVSFLLFPMGNALALVPWVLWSVERIVGGRGVFLLALTAGLQLLGGHPETCAHTALLATIYLLVRGARPAAWLRFAAGWTIAALIAAVQILPLLLLLPETSKWAAEGGASPPLALLLQQPLRLVLPQLYGHPAEGTWWGPFNYSATAVYAGALALPLAAAGIVRVRKDRRWLAVAVVLAFSFLAAYHMPGVRDILGALPILGRAAHHRLIFGIELGLALLAGAGCDRWLEGKGRGMLAGAVAVLALVLMAWTLLSNDWLNHKIVGQQLLWTMGVGGLVSALLLLFTLPRERRWSAYPILPALVLVDLLFAHGGILRAIPLERLYPETGAVAFLQGQTGRVAGVDQTLRPNAAMVYGLFDPRGDDPVKLERYENVYRSFAPGNPVYFEPIQRWDDPWLDRLGVRWVMTAPGARRTDWRLAYEGSDARVYERPGALPLVRWADGGEPPSILRQEPGRWEIGWRTPRPATLVVAETWDRGWTATVDGKPAPVIPVDGALLGVELGPGAGRLELRYRPAGLLPGALLSLAGLLALAFTLRASKKEAPKREAVPVEIRATRPEDLPSLSALFEQRFGHPLDPEEWEWKYRLLPGESRSRVAVAGGEVVAHAGALCLPARLPEGDAGIWQLVDFAGTAKGGLRPPLVDLGRQLLADLPRPQDAPWIFGFPSERHFRLGERVFGYKPLVELETLAGPLPEGTSDARLETGDQAGEWAERIWERCGVPGVRRSAAFLNWRYWARPRRYYRFYRMVSGAEEGLAVFAFVGEEAWAAEIWLPPSGEWYPSMLAAAADLRAAGLRGWRFWPPVSPGLDPLYRQLGLRPTGERRFVGCRGRAGDFTYSMGDYDLV